MKPPFTTSVPDDDNELLQPPEPAEKELSKLTKLVLTILGGLGLLAVVLFVSLLVAVAFLAYSLTGSSPGTGDQAEPLADSVTFSRCESSRADSVGTVTMVFTNPEAGSEIASIAIRIQVRDDRESLRFDDTWVFRGIGPGESVSGTAEFIVSAEQSVPLECEVAWITVTHG
ncbi:MAG: hypothetical protein ACR2QK_09475 [Acidimicrobiales bacterium]